jgi:[ribosomal protein S5]-alanine N-acetyltransferase
MIILESERILFRPHEAADLEAFCAMEQDSDVRRYVGGAPRTREVAEERFWNRAMQIVDDRLAMWACVLKANGVYIGRCGLYANVHGEKRIPGEAVLGYYLRREFWGQGLATEAARAFVTFGFEELKLNRIVSTVQEGNESSLHILKKLGFVVTDYEQGERSFYKFERKNPRILEVFAGGASC